MEKICPLSLAELQWDNVGLLVEAPYPRENATRVFLTIDLTSQVLEECLSDPSTGVIISYHPPLFKSFKRLTMSDEKQSIALKCAAAGVSVYSPHTALDR
jgi:putative NIF3 family GTP cyclohydrolase 1 type 2